jgi:hypothetical protein
MVVPGSTYFSSHTFFIYSICLAELCGASYINEEYQKFLSNRLKDETYLERNGKTINSIVESKVIEFENGEKRIFNIRDEAFEPDPISIDYLEPNVEKGFEQNRLKITR